VRYVGQSEDPWTRAKAHQMHIPHDTRVFIPIRGSRQVREEFERHMIEHLRPSHNRNGNPTPAISVSVTTAFKKSVLWRVWTNRELANAIRKCATIDGITPHEWIKAVLVESARLKGLTIKTPPAPQDARCKRSAA
jgi:hypothetical protein